MKKKQLVVAFSAVVVLGVSGSAFADTFVLEGDYLKVGVSNSGGLIDDNFDIGIDYDKTGNAAWTSFDVLKPGTPFQFYSIGVNGSSQEAGYYSGNNFGATTTNTSVGTINSAKTTGTYGALIFEQNLYFDDLSGIIHYSVTLFNAGNTDLTGVAYATGFDPDQDVYAGGDYDTVNTIGTDRVVAYAPVTEWGTAIIGDGVKSVDQGWDTNPYNLVTEHNDGNGDYTINMAWEIGDLAAGASKTINYDYALGTDDSGHTVPEPATMLLFGTGLAGLAGARLRRKK
jgi:hypothetical protein